MFTKKIGGVRDEKDLRDLKYEEIMGVSSDILPDSFKLDFDNRIKSQGRTSSCGCQASSQLLSTIFEKELSARYIFKEIKTNPEYPSSKLKWGQYTRDAIKVIVKNGSCVESMAPEQSLYSDNAYLSIHLTPQMRISANNYKAHKYVRVDGSFGNDFENVKNFIHKEKRPVIVAMPWYSSYNKAKKTGILPPPQGKQQGHIILCIGWNEDNYIFVNSYGKKWGTKGLFKAPRTTPTYDCWGIIHNNDIKLPNQNYVRNLALEREKAKGMQRELYKKFDWNDKARRIAGLEWLLIINALSYRNYSYTDIINYCYAKSRKQKVPFDLNNYR